jgi:hypothetical protein
MINTWYGRGDIPIGRIAGARKGGSGGYLAAAQAARAADGSSPFAHDLTPDTETLEASALMRKVLSAQPDGSVVLVVVGGQANAARLLESGPDEYSPLTGRELIEKKIRMLSIMAGSFISPDQGPVPIAGKPEANIRFNVKDARIVMHQWPTDVVVCPFLLGVQTAFPATVIERDFCNTPPHPVPYAYIGRGHMPYDRPSWDVVSVFYPARANRGYFTEGPRGRVHVDEKGYTTFEETPDGNTVILSATPEQRIRIIEAFSALATERPGARR